MKINGWVAPVASRRPGQVPPPRLAGHLLKNRYPTTTAHPPERLLPDLSLCPPAGDPPSGRGILLETCARSGYAANGALDFRVALR